MALPREATGKRGAPDTVAFFECEHIPMALKGASGAHASITMQFAPFGDNSRYGNELSRCATHHCRRKEKYVHVSNGLVSSTVAPLQRNADARDWSVEIDAPAKRAAPVAVRHSVEDENATVPLVVPRMEHI